MNKEEKMSEERYLLLLIGKANVGFVLAKSQSTLELKTLQFLFPSSFLAC